MEVLVYWFITGIICVVLYEFCDVSKLNNTSGRTKLDQFFAAAFIMAVGGFILPFALPALLAAFIITKAIPKLEPMLKKKFAKKNSCLII